MIVSAAGGLPETLREAETGWAVPRVASAVAAKLDLLDDSDLRIRLARAAAAFASAATWSRATSELEQVLKTVCKTRSTLEGASSSTS